VFAETSTLGLRIHAAERRVEERRMIQVETPWGSVRGKLSGQGQFTPEYDDCRAIAERTGTPLWQVMAAAREAFLKSK
jgi:pyridinium-3,5-bisthiocarboxylic acid mononucleotide nickel chelatase